MKIIINFIALFCVNFIFSQEISGVVLNQDNQPVSGATIYLDGTTYLTISNTNGVFVLKTLTKLESILVVRAIGFETQYIEKPFDKELVIKLKQKVEALNEVVVTKELFSRKQKMALFKKCFLGETKAGKSCKILNEDDIVLVYDYDKFTLSATASQPILVQNEYLGYEIQFDLVDFKAQMNRKSIDNESVRGSYFFGTTIFVSTNDAEKTLKNRKKTYLGSSKHFFKNLTKNIWSKNEFLLFKNSFQTSPSEYFKVEKKDSYFEVTVLKNDYDKIKIESVESKFLQNLNVLFDNSEQSGINFRTKTFKVDFLGNNSDVDKIEYTGEMAKHKLGYMLPYNYDFQN